MWNSIRGTISCSAMSAFVFLPPPSSLAYFWDNGPQDASDCLHNTNTVQNWISDEFKLEFIYKNKVFIYDGKKNMSRTNEPSFTRHRLAGGFKPPQKNKAGLAKKEATFQSLIVIKQF